MKKLFLGLMFIFMAVSLAGADQHDYVIGNAPGAILRADINNAFKAIVTNNSGATEPSVIYPNMWWFDTSTNLLKYRNNANDAWIINGLEAADTDGTLSANSDLKIPTQKAVKTYADTKMALSGNETIAGIKTYSSSPIVPTPTTDMQASTKKYVDDHVVASSTTSLGTSFTSGTVYQNTRTRKIMVVAYATFGTNCELSGYIGSSNPPTIMVVDTVGSYGSAQTGTFVVPPNYYWKVVVSGGALGRCETWEI